MNSPDQQHNTHLPPTPICGQRLSLILGLSLALVGCTGENTTPVAQVAVLPSTSPVTTPTMPAPVGTTSEPTTSDAPNNAIIDRVWVHISSGARQCEFPGHSLEVTANTLTEAGVDVLDSHCGVITGMMSAAVCGGPTPAINLHEIPQSQLEQAQSLNYRTVESLGPELAYEQRPCPNTEDNAQ